MPRASCLSRTLEAGVVGLNEEVSERPSLEQVHQRDEELTGRGGPGAQGGAGELHAVALVEDGALSVERQAVLELARHQRREEAGAWERTGQRRLARRCTDDAVTAAGAGELRPLLDEDEEPRRLELESLADLRRTDGLLLESAPTAAVPGRGQHLALAPLEVGRQGLDAPDGGHLPRLALRRAIVRARRPGLREGRHDGGLGIGLREGRQEREHELKLARTHPLAPATEELPQGLLEPDRGGVLGLFEPRHQVDEHLDGFGAATLLELREHIAANAVQVGRLWGRHLLRLELPQLVFDDVRRRQGERGCLSLRVRRQSHSSLGPPLERQCVREPLPLRGARVAARSAASA